MFSVFLSASWFKGGCLSIRLLWVWPVCDWLIDLSHLCSGQTGVVLLCLEMRRERNLTSLNGEKCFSVQWVSQSRAHNFPPRLGGVELTTKPQGSGGGGGLQSRGRICLCLYSDGAGVYSTTALNGSERRTRRSGERREGVFPDILSGISKRYIIATSFSGRVVQPP